MPINGSLDEASLADVLQLLALGRKTGRLSVSDQSNLGHVFLDDGKITHAFLVNRRHRLGDILFKNGHITQHQLTDAIHLQEKNPHKKVGEILVETGAISEDALRHYMQVQIEEAVYFLFTWRRGDFAFERDVRPDPHDFLVSINPESLLLEGARRVDEWSVIEKKIPSFDMVFRVDHERIKASNAKLAEEQERIAKLLDGERSVAAIVAETGMIQFEVGKALYGLISAGFAEAVAPDRPQTTDGAADNQHTDHLDYAELLAYLSEQAEFASAERRRKSGLHIADCPTCSKRLQEIHIRRSQGLSAIPDGSAEAGKAAEPKRRASDRRKGPDRRQSDATVPIGRESDRRIHGAGDRRSSTRTAAVTGRPPTDRRSGIDRRRGQRRQGERRKAAFVDRSDRYAVERRRGLERRHRERRVVPRRVADVRLGGFVGGRQTATLELGSGYPGRSGTTTRTSTTGISLKASGEPGSTKRSTASGGGGGGARKARSPSGDRKTGARQASEQTNHAPTEPQVQGPQPQRDESTAATGGSTPQHHQPPPAEPPPPLAPATPAKRPTRPSVRRMRESPLRGLPLLVDGTEWMFVDRSEEEEQTDELKSTSRTTEIDIVAPRPDARTTDVDIVAPAPPVGTTEAGTKKPDPAARTTEVNIAAPVREAGTPTVPDRTPQTVPARTRRTVEPPPRRTSKWKSMFAPRESDAEKAKRELEKARAEADRAKSDAEKAKREADRVRQEAERAKAAAEKARSEAERATKQAEKATSKAEKATTKAESEKTEATKRKSEAIQTTSEAQKAKQEVEKARSETELAKSEADAARSEAERARREAEQAREEAERLRREAEAAKVDAEKARSEAELATRSAEEATAQAQITTTKVANERSAAAKRKAEVVQAKTEAEKARREVERAKLDAAEAATKAELAMSEADEARSEAEKARHEAEQAREDAERLRREAETARAEAARAAAHAHEPRMGRGTPVKLRELTGVASQAAEAVTVEAKAPVARKHRRKASTARDVRRIPVAWLAIAAVAVLATAIGWLVRPLLDRGTPAGTTTSLSTPVQQQPPAETPAAIVDTAPGEATAPVSPADSLEPDRLAATPRATQSPARTGAETTAAEAAARETQLDRQARLGAQPTPAQNRPAAIPVQQQTERVAEAQPAAPPAEQPHAQERPDSAVAAAEAVSASATVAGTVRAAGTGTPLAGVVVSLSNRDLTTTTNAAGVFAFSGVAPGPLHLMAARDGYIPHRQEVVAEAGAPIQLEMVLREPPAAAEPDEEMGGDQWALSDAAEAKAILGVPVPVISDLWIESIARPATGTRPRIRVAQLTDSGERISLVVSRSGPANRASIPRVTALRIIPPTEAYPITTGTASFGTLLVTAKSTLAAESLRALLQQLVEADGG